ncbi:SIS domain-containing protein [Caproiciproducens galactitolivorans]|uniref:Fructosamine deglycase FrlB n=1 Tax=Caproiciproducens galactitolivorans TaxID=642589 RepID=A0A4Z0YGS4_9FIRM|nr:SIS domain-containing protein [Caproiciproducens galactitolivorans]QEY35165.1 SIS domain-containing protein [Caproiciproducens galactitolivorans]TGJ76856.1 fructosamine deglycase FrlB [Caproiciproducens galactitolivorans]
MEVKKIVSEIKKEVPGIKSVYYVGCGASKAELYPGKYFLEQNAKVLRAGHFTANEFVHATPVGVDSTAIVITCSLGGNTPETVAASKLAMEKGAKVIAVTHKEDSPLAQNAHYVIVHGFEKNYAAKLEKMVNVLDLSVEILNHYEGYEHYEDMQTAFGKIYDMIENAVSFVLPAAKKFAQDYKDAPFVYVMSSGATQCVAYTFSLCLMMEMQWINSGCFHDGEFFHGPFEIVDKDVPFILLMNSGRTRALDARAMDFLHRFQAKATIVDGKDYGIDSLPPAVAEYFNPMILSAVMRVYAEQIAIVRSHPLTMRRYMWKLEY